MTYSSREAILTSVRSALGRTQGSPSPVPPADSRIPPRTAGEPTAEMEMLLNEIGKIGGIAARLTPEDLQASLAGLVHSEGIRKATVWPVPELAALGVERILSTLGVEVISPLAGKHALAECDLGVTTADGAFPETGTLLLRSGADRPRMVSLLPRVHLALLAPVVLYSDLPSGFAAVRGSGSFFFVTGPSRTADIELTVTIGVHGPQALYVWAID